MKNILEEIEKLYDNPPIIYLEEDKDVFKKFIDLLNIGVIRTVNKTNGKWEVNKIVKKGILVGFRLGEVNKIKCNSHYYFSDKDTFPLKNISVESNIRLVPGGSSVRTGAYIGKNVTMMPPMYINTGAFVDDDTLIDSHALVGSCAYVGKRVHLSAGAILGGVLEPVGANPVIIEDDVFIGGNSGIYEGIIVKKKAIIAAGVTITSSTPIYDAVNKKYLEKNEDGIREIPENAVVISGTRKLKSDENFSVYCPIIIKYRDEKSDGSVVLEKDLR